MSEVLSQAEIDALLEGLSKGEITPELEEKKSYRAYDFRRPAKFSKENLRIIQLLHETFARQLPNYLAGHLRTDVRCVLDTMEQVTYEEFQKSLPSPKLICVCDLGGDEKPFLLEISLSLVFAVVDRILGGPGGSEVPERELTEIEKVVMEDVVIGILANLSTAWGTVLEIDFRLQKMECQPQFVQVVFPTEIVLTISFEVSISSSEGLLNICFPYTSLQEALDALNTEKWLSSKREQGRTGLVLKEELSSLKIPLSVELGRAKLLLSDIRRLEEGQVIRLDARVDDPVVVKVGKRPVYRALPGTLGKRLAVRICSRYEE